MHNNEFFKKSLKLKKALAFVLAVCMLLCTFLGYPLFSSALATEDTVDLSDLSGASGIMPLSNGDTVTITKGKKYDYANGFYTNEFWIAADGYSFLGTCIEPRKDGPDGQSFTANKVTDPIFRYLMWCYHSEEFRDEAFGSVSEDEYFILLHTTLGYYYCGESGFGEVENTGKAWINKADDVMNWVRKVFYGSSDARYVNARTAAKNLFDTYIVWGGNNYQDIVWIQPHDVSLTITKQSKTAVDLGERYLTGAKFELYGWDGTSYSKKVATSVDNGDGTYTFDGVNYMDAVEGKFLVKETTAPDGYNTSYYTYNADDKSDYDTYGGRQFVLNGSYLEWSCYSTRNHSDAEAGFTFLDNVNVKTLTVTKIDADTKAKLTGAEFELYAYRAKTAGYSEKIGTFKDNKDGTYTIALVFDMADISNGYYKYLIKETKAPAGYTLATDGLDAGLDGKVIYFDTKGVMKSDSSKLTFANKGSDVNFSIQKSSSNSALTNGNSWYNLKGANYTIYRDKNCTAYVATLETQSSGKTQSIALTPGTYYVKETIAATGYQLDTKVYEVVLTLDYRDTGYVLNVQDEPRIETVTVTVSKADAESGTALKGAVFRILAWNGSAYSVDKGNMADNGNGTYSKTITYDATNLGKFKIEETKNPTGYSGTWSQTFSINPYDNTSLNIVYKATNPQIKQNFSIEVIKKDSPTGNMLPGCTFTVYEYNKASGRYVEIGNLGWDSSAKKYTSGSNSALASKLVAKYGVNGNDGKFRITETVVPNGYVQSETWTKDFTVEVSTNTIVSKSFTVSNNPIRVLLKKVDENGKGLAGAKLQLIDASGNLIKEFTSTVEGLEVTNLVSGKTYTLKEISTPSGYVKAANVTFTVVDKKDVQTVTMKDIWTVTKIHKKDLSAKENYVSGASLELRKNKDDASTVITTVRGEKVQWTSGNSYKVFYGIQPGTYWLVETNTAPGYGVAEPVQVTVTASTTNEAVMYNPRYTELTVEKRIRADQIYFANGNPTFIIQIKGYDTQGNYHEYAEFFEFTQEYIKNNTGSDGYVSMSYTWTKIAAGTSYEVMEAAVNRYYLSAVTGNGSNVAIERLTESSYSTVPEDTFSVKVNLSVKPKGTKVVFTNEKYTYGDYSHNSVVKNTVLLK